MDMKQVIAERIAQSAEKCFENCGLSSSDIAVMLEMPPDKKLGDYALPCFRLAKTLRKGPPMIAHRTLPAKKLTTLRLSADT